MRTIGGLPPSRQAENVYGHVEGDFPPGVKFHGRLTDNDVRKIQSHNAKVVIMEPKYSADDLREAKQSCKQQ
jgi:hypothetical protein